MHIIIVGNGIAGITAARHIRKLSNHHVTVISSESPYFFARTALMYLFMGHMRWKDILPYEKWFWKKNKIALIQDRVTKINEIEKTIQTDSGHSYNYDRLILATGSTSNWLDVPGKDFEGVTGLYSLQDLQYIESQSSTIKRAVIVGGGLIGVELAEMFHSREIPVTMLVRESGYAYGMLPEEESSMITQHIRQHGIDLRLNTTLEAINGDATHRVKSVLTNTGDEIECQFAGITIGVSPNINWLKNSTLEKNTGLLVNEYLETSIKDIYAIGDCAELKNPAIGRKPIEPVWYTGRMMGESVAQTICTSPTKYQPGLWFNSAKFFDIEYQVYGDIRPQLPENHKTILWQNDQLTKSIRINYTEQGVVGFNLMGIRFRQEVCEKWIRSNTKIEVVLADLELALFDPEFSKNYAKEVRAIYAKMTGIRIASNGNGNYNRVFSFLQKAKKQIT